MDKGFVDLAKLRANIHKADFRGKSAYCFIKGDKIIKIYAIPNDGTDYCSLDTNKICNLSKFRADTIVFPDKYIYENRRKVGEILEYIPDFSIDNSFNDDANLDLIVNGYELVINDLYLYSNLEMIDLCYVNILYSNKNGFHIIDTTEWQMADNAIKANLYRLNSSLVNIVFRYLNIPIKYSKYYSKIDEVLMNNINNYGVPGIKLKKEIFNIINDVHVDFLELMFAYMDMYRIYSCSDAKRLEDIKEFTKVLKKG